MDKFKPASPRVAERLKQFETLKKLAAESRKKREIRKRQKDKKDCLLWMENFIFPLLRGLARSFNEPLLVGIKRLIREKKNPFRRKKDGWNRTKETEIVVGTFLGRPEIRMYLYLFKPLIRHKSEWIRREAQWVREEVLKEEFPDFYEVIMETEGGKEWLDELIRDLVNTLRRVLG